MIRVEWQVQGKTRDAIFTLKAGGRLRWASGPSGDEPLLRVPRIRPGWQASSRWPKLAGKDRAAERLRTQRGAPGQRSGDRDHLLTPAALSELIDTLASTPKRRPLPSSFSSRAPRARARRRSCERRRAAGAALSQTRKRVPVPVRSRAGTRAQQPSRRVRRRARRSRAVFSHDAIACLAREGVLVPVIDGFDELLGHGRLQRRVQLAADAPRRTRGLWHPGRLRPLRLL